MCLWLGLYDGERVDCVTDTDELAAFLGCQVADLISESGDPLGSEQCLCDLDAERTAEKFGYRVDYAPEFGQMAFVKGAA